MQLKHHQHVSLLSVTAECKRIADLAEEVLFSIDAARPASKVRELMKNFVTYQSTEDRTILQHASDAVKTAEDAFEIVVAVFESRTMAFSSKVEHIKSMTTLVAARLSRTLWDLAISSGDKRALRDIFNSLGVCMQFWEEIPAHMRGADYEYISGNNSGLMAFIHCFGYTFIEYKAGRMEKGWSISLDNIEHAIKVYKDRGVTEACLSLNCYAKK